MLDHPDRNLIENNLTEISKSNFHGLKKIQSLNLYKNNLSTLPADLFSEVSLDEILFISNNQLLEIPMNLFCSNSCSHQLQWLFLQNNNLTFLQTNTFKGLKNMTHVFLHGNHIQSLRHDVFAGTRLEYIFMFSNRLNTIANKSFHGVYDSLLEIHIYKNNISSFSNDGLPTSKQKLTVYVDCDKLQEVTKIHDNTTIACAKHTNLPGIRITGTQIDSIKAALTSEAFYCNSTTRKPICAPCPSGTFGNGEKGCIPCPPGGFYQDEVGHTRCKQCKIGTFTRKAMSKSYRDCEACPVGTVPDLFAGHRACFCKKNFTRTDRFMGCKQCFEEGLNCTQDYKSLLPGYYWNWHFNGTNITEYSNFVSLLQNDSPVYTNNTGSRYHSRIPKVYQCPRRYSCINTNSSSAEHIEGNCDEGYKGWLCNICENRRYRLLNVCIPCPAPVWIALEVIAILCLAFGLYYIISRQIKIDKKHIKEDRSLVDKLMSKMKIVLGFYQVVGELCESFYDHVKVEGMYQFVGKLISFLKFNLLRVIIRPHCYSENFKIDVKNQFIICLLFPFIMSVILLCCYFSWKLYLKYKPCYQKEVKDVTMRKVRERLLTYALFLSFITYPPTCAVIFKLYPGACKTFYIYDNDTSFNITILRADFGINCNTLRTYQLLAYAATLCYVFAFPCTLYFLLRKHCKRNFVIRFDDQNIFNRESQRCSLTNDDTNLIHHKPLYVGIPVWLKFLCGNYKPEYWYWEVFELTRKVIQTVLVTLLGWEDVLTKLLTISISVLFLTLHARLSPMICNSEQRLQMFSLAAIFINVLVASMPIPHCYQEPISIGLIILNMIIIAVVAAEVVVVIVRFMIIKRKFQSSTLNENKNLLAPDEKLWS